MKRFKWMAIPYFVWLGILVFIPVIILLVLSFANTNGVSFSGAEPTISNWIEVFDPVYTKAIYNSFKIALLTTLFCFLIGYPAAYIISFSNLKKKMVILLCLILPMWTNMLLRIIAWEKLFNPVNILGINWDLIGSEAAVIFVNVTTYLPFMIYPIYTILEKMDRSLVEASIDLGTPKWKAFLKVTFPLSLKGVCSGVIMVFLPTATGFAISERIGGGQILLIGNVIQNFFDKAFNFNLGSVVAIIVSIVIIIVVLLFQKVDKEGESLL